MGGRAVKRHNTVRCGKATATLLRGWRGVGPTSWLVVGSIGYLVKQLALAKAFDIKEI